MVNVYLTEQEWQLIKHAISVLRSETNSADWRNYDRLYNKLYVKEEGWVRFVESTD